MASAPGAGITDTIEIGFGNITTDIGLCCLYSKKLREDVLLLRSGLARPALSQHVRASLNALGIPRLAVATPVVVLTAFVRDEVLATLACSGRAPLASAPLSCSLRVTCSSHLYYTRRESPDHERPDFTRQISRASGMVSTHGHGDGAASTAARLTPGQAEVVGVCQSRISVKGRHYRLCSDYYPSRICSLSASTLCSVSEGRARAARPGLAAETHATGLLSRRTGLLGEILLDAYEKLTALGILGCPRKRVGRDRRTAMHHGNVNMYAPLS